MPDIKDKEGDVIQPGDKVMTKIRGGKREGEVDKIVTTEEEAKEEDVKNPPKVGVTHLGARHCADIASGTVQRSTWPRCRSQSRNLDTRGEVIPLRASNKLCRKRDSIEALTMSP
jgi:hypothetical protein